MTAVPAQARQAAPVESNVEALRSGRPGSGERLLIVEDDVSTGRMLELILGAKGFEVEVVGTGSESIERVRARSFDLAFVDVRLPDALGSELIGPLHELCSDLIVVMVTAYASVENAIFALNHGAAAYLTKPLDVDALLSVVRESLSKQQLARENVRLLESLRRELAERAKAELELRRLRTIIESTTTDFVGMTRPDGRFLYINRRGRGMVGLSADADVSPLNITDLHPESARQLLRTIALPAAERDGVWTGEIAFNGPPGSGEVLTSMTLLAHRGAGGAVELFSTISRDITEERSLQRRLQVAQRMEAVGRLAGGIAHDFNNCLQVVVGHAKLLKDELELSSTGPAKEAIRSVIAAGQRAARLTEQLLAFSRRQVQRLAPIDLNQVVIGMDPMIRRLVGADVTLDVSLADDLGIVIADKAQLEQILINLVVNAREAMPRGGDLRIETRNAGAPRTFVCRTGDLSLLDERTERPAGDYVLLAVTDTGCGMAGETLARIFEPFYTTKSDGQGTGLGLSTVYGIVRQSAGFIEVDSAVGNGTSFRIHLPRSAQRVDPRAPALRAAPRRGTETVLLVDDEAMVRRVVCRILQLHGFRVLQAGSGNEALLAAERYPHQIHLLLTDLVMPKMGGEQLAEQLRRIRPDLRILYMSGYTEQRVGETLPLAGDVGFIPKPFSPDRLVAAVCSVLDYERPS